MMIFPVPDGETLLLLTRKRESTHFFVFHTSLKMTLIISKSQYEIKRYISVTPNHSNISPSFEYFPFKKLMNTLIDPCIGYCSDQISYKITGEEKVCSMTLLSEPPPGLFQYSLTSDAIRNRMLYPLHFTTGPSNLVEGGKQTNSEYTVSPVLSHLIYADDPVYRFVGISMIPLFSYEKTNTTATIVLPNATHWTCNRNIPSWLCPFP